MEPFPWWTDQQKKFAEELYKFVNEHIPAAEKAFWTRKFPMDIVKKVQEKGYFGAGIPKKYGGMELGATGCCIAAEQLGRLYAVGHVFVVSMLGGYHQLLHYGTEEQKKKWLTKMAKGQLGAVCITEPFAGSDAASVMTTARKEGDEWVIMGRKRFITGAGPADRYFVYAKTSDDPEVIRRYGHLTAFIVEKGTPGFSLEKINELIGFENVPNGYLNFDDVRVPDENRVGDVGAGWAVMTSGLNFERLVGSAVVGGGLEDIIKMVIYYTNRRVQFKQQTSRFVNNQFKIADMITWNKLARLITYYTAMLLDSGQNAAVESSIAKLLNTDYAIQTGLDAVQIMAGDGLTKFYPVERLVREGKIGQIVAGTNEIQKLIIYRMGALSYLDMPFRLRIDPELEIPVLSLDDSPWKGKEITEEVMLKILAEDYRVNPGLYMTIEDLQKETGLGKEKVLELVSALEQKKLVVNFRDSRGNIIMSKANYEGLRRAYPPEHYRYFPNWFDPEELGFFG
ncbi:MAG: acyl-CoA dehydrogenase family protein [Candidatus Freyarchaeota archaeon]